MKGNDSCRPITITWMNKGSDSSWKLVASKRRMKRRAVSNWTFELTKTFKISLSDDPYYCGLRARIPNFAKSKSQKEKEANALYARLPAHSKSAMALQHSPYGPVGHYAAWPPQQGRGYIDNGERSAKFF